MRETFAAGDMSMRNESNFLHEAIFNGIKTQINTYMPNWDVSFSTNKIGSERLFFTFGDYIFILKITGTPSLHDVLNTKKQISILSLWNTP